MLKKYKPSSPAQRHLILINNQQLTNQPKFKHLVKGFKRCFGKNNQGKITIKHRGGGHKRTYRQISFLRTSIHKGKVLTIEYDPNRSANIAAIFNSKLCFEFYIIAPNGLKIGDFIKTSFASEANIGNSLPLTNIAIGTNIHNIALNKNQPAKLTRSAGTTAQVIQKNTNKILVRLPSGQNIPLPSNSLATIGRVSNLEFSNIVSSKAGRSRWLNRRPKVRGVAKNPIDHPHGGGEGKTSGGRPSVSFKGKITKGKPTVRKKGKTLLK